MIQTKNNIIYGDRDEKSGKIMIEVSIARTTKEGTVYLVNDWDITKPEDKDPYKSKEVFYSNQKLNQLDQYISAEFGSELVGLSRVEAEWKKQQIGLMIDTTTNLFPTGNTIYRLSPSDWEFTPTIE